MQKWISKAFQITVAFAALGSAVMLSFYFGVNYGYAKARYEMMFIPPQRAPQKQTEWQTGEYLLYQTPTAPTNTLTL